jgi:hypothetical protein
MPKRIDQPIAAERASQLIGTWKLASFAVEDAETRDRAATFGDRPRGYLAFTEDGRMFGFATAEGRTAPQTDDERCSAFGSMIAYSGRYQADGETFITTVDIAWNESWVGTDQVRHYRLEKRQLHVMSVPQPIAELGGRHGRYVLTWDKENTGRQAGFLGLRRSVASNRVYR